jgi:hypothetical protein
LRRSACSVRMTCFCVSSASLCSTVTGPANVALRRTVLAPDHSTSVMGTVIRRARVFAFDGC